MKLYNAPIPAPNPRRVRIFLAEKGVSLPLEDVSIRDRAHKSPEFRQKNSLGQLPVLELDDGTHLSESVAICRYLEELHPAPPLFGSTALERANVDMWIRRIELAVMTAVGAVWVHTHPFTARLGTQYKDYGESNRERYAKALQWFDRELEGREFVTGSRYTMADIIGLATVDFAKFIGLEMPPDTPHLHAWHARVSARPSAAA